MKKKLLVFDLDGTLVDLYSVKDWLPMLLKEDPTPYKIAKPIYDMKEINKTIEALKEKGYEICVTTWLSKDSSMAYDKEVEKAKKEWLNKYNFKYDYLHCVPYGYPKEKVTEPFNYGYSTQIIFDDDEKVLNSWNLGETVDSKKNILNYLKYLLTI